MTRISIITIALNVAPQLRRTIESVNRQTYAEIEHVIVDGGSTDGSREVITVEARRAVAWVSEPDRGIADAFNKGTQMATGSFVCYLNAGDVFVDDEVIDRVAIQIEQNSSASSTVFYGDFFSSRGELHFFHVAAAELSAFAWNNPLNHQSTFIPRQLALDHPYDSRLRLGMDYDFWLRIISEVRFEHLGFPVAIFASDGRSSDPRWAVHNLTARRVLWHINRGSRMNLADITQIWWRATRLWAKIGLKGILGDRGMGSLRRRKSTRSITAGMREVPSGERAPAEKGRLEFPPG